MEGREIRWDKNIYTTDWAIDLNYVLTQVH